MNEDILYFEPRVTPTQWIGLVPYLHALTVQEKIRRQLKGKDYCFLACVRKFEGNPFLTSNL